MSDTLPNATQMQVQPDSLPHTALATALAPFALPLAAYRGTQTVEVYSDTANELAALLDNCGVYDLGWRSFLRCSGRDRVRWLNGMVTNSVKGLEKNAGCYAFVLNAQGRIQGDLEIYWLAGTEDQSTEQEALWIETDRSQSETLSTFLRRYIIMDQVVLEPRNSWTALGIAGPHAAKIVASLGLPVEALSPIHVEESLWQGHAVVLVADHAPRVPRFQIWIDSDAVAELWAALTASGAIPCGASAIDQLRILEGTPAYGVDIADRDLPQETNQVRALNFTKGCYLGQEIVERIRSRGNVHRTFSGFLLDGEPPALRSSILLDGKPVGEITSTARVRPPSAGERTVALGYIRREALESQQLLTVNGSAIRPCALPFDFTGAAIHP